MRFRSHAEQSQGLAPSRCTNATIVALATRTAQRRSIWPRSPSHDRTRPTWPKGGTTYGNAIDLYALGHPAGDDHSPMAARTRTEEGPRWLDLDARSRPRSGVAYMSSKVVTSENPSVFRKDLMSSSDTSPPTPKELGTEPRRRTGVRTVIWMGLVWLVVIVVALFPFPWWW